MLETINKIKESRYEIMTKIFENLEVVPESQNSNIMIIRKKFYFGDVTDYDKDTDTEIIRLEASLKFLEKDGPKYKDLLDYINKSIDLE